MKADQIDTLVTFLQAVGQQERLQILGILAERPSSIPELAKRTGFKETAVLKHIGRLKQAALITSTAPFTFQLDEKMLAQINHTVFHRQDSQNKETLRQRVLRHYTEGASLMRLPDNEAELLEILSWLAERFQSEKSYPEQAVNTLIHQAHPDHAQMRRLLVDHGFLTRSRGIYQKVVEQETKPERFT